MPWARNFCPFRAYWIISSDQVNIVLVVFFTCPNVVMDNQQETNVQGEALFIVVSLAATLGLHGPRRGDILAKLFHFMALFLAMA